MNALVYVNVDLVHFFFYADYPSISSFGRKNLILGPMVINALDLSSLLGQLGLKKGRGLQSSIELNWKAKILFFKNYFKKC